LLRVIGLSRDGEPEPHDQVDGRVDSRLIWTIWFDLDLSCDFYQNILPYRLDLDGLESQPSFEQDFHRHYLYILLFHTYQIFILCEIS
jgi:hypothetical protein